MFPTFGRGGVGHVLIVRYGELQSPTVSSCGLTLLPARLALLSPPAELRSETSHLVNAVFARLVC